MSFENLKLNKQIITAMQESGFISSRTVQDKCVNRFAGGQDWTVLGPEGCGKTTSYILAAIMKTKYAFEDAPRVLVLTHSKEKVRETVAQFEALAKNTDLRVIGLETGVGMQDQRDDLFAGVDIVVGTPDRTHTIYINSGLNVNKVQMFVLDDAELMIKQGFQAQIYRLKEALPNKTQTLCFSEVYHDKLDHLVSKLLNSQGTIEIQEEVEKELNLNDLELYSVLNYKTKLNLINLLTQREGFDKLVVFCNTRLTCGQLYNSISKRQEGTCAILNPLFYNQVQAQSIASFMETPELKYLFVSNEDDNIVECSQMSNSLHFDIPESLDLMISRFNVTESDFEQRFMLFATDIEQIIIKKLQNKTGINYQLMDNPIGLIVEGNRKRKPKVEEDKDPTSGGAFHEKKASNSKTVNLGTKEKMKLYGKARKGSSRFKDNS